MMNKAEIFYRKKYPKVGELTHMDTEIIGLLDGYEKELNQGELLPKHVVMQSDYPPEYIRIACAEYYKKDTPLKAIKLINKYTKMSVTTAKAYCDSHFA